MRVQPTSRSSAGILLLDLFVRQQNTDARVHGLLVLPVRFTEQAMVAKDGEGYSTRVLVYNGAWATLCVAL